MYFSTAKGALSYLEIQATKDNYEIPIAIFIAFLMLTTALKPNDAVKAELNPLVNGLKDKPLTLEHLKDIQEGLMTKLV